MVITEFAGIVMEDRDESRNACELIVVTLSGKITEFKLELY